MSEDPVYVIKIVSRVDGIIDKHASKYIKSFDPTQGQFIGGTGTLETVVLAKDALAFESGGSAYDFWKAQYGERPWDGRPNRPLTAYTVEIEAA